MKITKIGHCCLLIEEGDLRILTDPGSYTIAKQSELTGLNAIFITHEHQDHFHLESLRQVLINNPTAKIFTNRAVQALLSKEKISADLLEHGGSATVGAMSVEGYGEIHADIYREIKPVQNTGFFFARKFFFPGDALFVPPRQVEVLALPVAGPWIKISEAIDYAREIRPKAAFSVHDGGLKDPRLFQRWPRQFLTEKSIEFWDPEEAILEL